MAQQSTLALRVEALLDQRRDRRPLNGGVLLASLAATAFTFVGSALAQVSTREELTPPGNSSLEKSLRVTAPQSPEALVSQYVAAIVQQDREALRRLILPAMYNGANNVERAYLESALVDGPLTSASSYTAPPEVSVRPWEESSIRVQPDWRWPVQPTLQISITADHSTAGYSAIIAAVETEGRFFLVGPLPPRAASIGDTIAVPETETKTTTPPATEISAIAAPSPIATSNTIPVEIKADATYFESGVAVAKGNATFTFEKVKLSANTVRYEADTRTVTGQGNVDFTAENSNRIVGPDALLEYNLETKKVRMTGKHRTFVNDPGGK